MPSGSIPHGNQRSNSASRHINRVLVDPDVGYTPGERDAAQISRADFLNTPANIEAEYGVLGAIYLDNDVFARIGEIITASDFNNEKHRAIFRAMQTLYERGDPIDYVSVPDELQRTNQVEQAGGLAYATSATFTNACAAAWRGIPYAEIIARHARKREALDITQRVVAKIYDADVTAEQALAVVTNEFQPLADKLTDNQRINGGIISARDLMEREIPEMNWPIEAIMPEGLAIIGAPPKTGKSAIALQLALSLATGGKALGNAKTKQGSVLYLALEDSLARMKERIERQMCGEPVPKNLDIMFSSPPMLDGGLIQIESWLRTHEDAQAVFIDTIGRFRGLGSQADNSNLFTADYQDMAKLQTLALNHHVAIVALHHLRKDRTGVDPLEALSGTTGISAAADAVWIISRDRNQELGELQIIGRDVQEQNIAVKLSSLTLTWQAIGDADDVALKEGQRKVFEALRMIGEAGTPTDIAAHTGEKVGAVKTRCVRMKGEGLLVSVGTGKYWFSRQRPNGF